MTKGNVLREEEDHSIFKGITIYSMQGWTTTTNHGYIRKKGIKRTKKEKKTKSKQEKLFRENLKLKGAYQL